MVQKRRERLEMKIRIGVEIERDQKVIGLPRVKFLGRKEESKTVLNQKKASVETDPGDNTNPEETGKTSEAALQIPTVEKKDTHDLAPMMIPEEMGDTVILSLPIQKLKERNITVEMTADPGHHNHQQETGKTLDPIPLTTTEDTIGTAVLAQKMPQEDMKLPHI
jgi:hypothetical protein